LYHFILGIQIALKYSGSEITEILYSTVVLWQGKFCIYYRSSETLEVIYDKLYYGGENLVSIYYTEVQNSPPSKLRQLHYGGVIKYIL